MDVQIIASIIGGLISGLFTFLGVLLTLIYQRKKDQKEERRIKNEEIREQFNRRPRMEINKIIDVETYQEDEVDLGMLYCIIRDFKNNSRPEFYYDKEIINPEKWVGVEYELINTGLTEIKEIVFSTNLLRNTALFNTSDKINEICYHYHMLSYKATLNKTIKPRDKIKIRYILLRIK